MRKKILKILCINTILFLALFFILDVACYFYQVKRLTIEKLPASEFNYSVMQFNDFYKKKKLNNGFRNSLKINSDKNPIIIFGGSYAYGHLLEKNQTISYKLSEATNRSVYNRAINGSGIQYMLYQLSRKDFLPKVKNPEFIVYVFIDHHVCRLYRYAFGILENVVDVRYKNTGETLKEDQSPLKYLAFSYQLKLLQESLSNKKYEDEALVDENFDFMKKHFLESKKIAEQKYPNVKMVILKYETIDEDVRYFKSNRWKELKDAGFIVLDTNDLAGRSLCSREYTISEYDSHPNAKAWDLIVPKLVKELNL